MPKHIVRLLLLMVVGATIGYAAKQFFTPASYYQFGHYRGDSVVEIASDKPKYGTPQACEKCHAAKYAEWAKGVHNKSGEGKVVKCEVCHGASSSRDVKGVFDNVTTGKDHPNNLKMTIPKDTAKLCTLCHEKMPGRPAEQRQIVVATHAGAEACTSCHNPHSPRNFVMAAASAPQGDAAKGRKLAENCAGCHGELGVSEKLSGPSLAGQKGAYLAAVLKAYKTGGERNDSTMIGMVEGISDADKDNLAAFYSVLKCKSAQDGEKAAASAGQALAGRCASCHGAGGISPQAAWPNLAGLSTGYLIGALKGYKEGARKNGTMVGIAKELSDKDAANLAAYYANASCK